MDAIWRLIGYSAMLSLLAIGGLNTVLPEFFRYVVVEQKLLTPAQFTAYVGLGQAAPGPNFLLVTLVGYHIAGLFGAFAVTLAFCVPSALVAYLTVGIGKRTGDRPWKRVLRLGLAPLTVGLVLASGYVITLAAPAGAIGYSITALAALVASTTRLNPLWLLAAAGIAGGIFVRL